MIEKIKQPTHAVSLKLPLETYERLQALCKNNMRSTNMMIQHMIHNTPLPSVVEIKSEGLLANDIASRATLYNYMAPGQR
jgi:hypothetical protein